MFRDSRWVYFVVGDIGSSLPALWHAQKKEVAPEMPAQWIRGVTRE